MSTQNHLAHPAIKLFVVVLMMLSTACAHIGPKTVTVDRFDYSAAIADSWKQQTLLNIVKLRYMDLPVFVDVASVVSGYSLETGATLGAQFSPSSQLIGNTYTLGGSGKYTDRPTITYMPMTGEKFLRGMITPIDPKNIFFLLQTGYPADFILGLTVDSLNGERNRAMASGHAREPDPGFVRILELLRDIQAAGALGLRVEEGKDKNTTAVVFFRRDDLTTEMRAKIDEVRQLLKLAPDQHRFTLLYSPVRGTENEFAVNSRSMLQILSTFAGYVSVPESHINSHRASHGFDVSDTKHKNIVSIRSGKEKPQDTYVAIQYRDHWFWIDDGDLQTKRAITAIMFFFTLSDSGGNEKMPLITIPAQ